MLNLISCSDSIASNVIIFYLRAQKALELIAMDVWGKFILHKRFQGRKTIKSGVKILRLEKSVGWERIVNPSVIKRVVGHE